MSQSEPFQMKDRWWLPVNILRVLTPAGSLRGQLMRGGLGSILVKLLQVILTFLVTVFLARSLGSANYGIFAFIQSMVLVLAIPAQLGLPELVVRETAKAQASNSWGMMRGLWRWSTAAVLVFSALITTTTLSISWCLADRISSVHTATLLFGLLLIPLVALGNLRGAALRGLRHVVTGQLPESVLRPGLMIVFLMPLLASTAVNTISPPQAMALLVLASVGAFVIGAILLWRARPAPLAACPTPVYRTGDWIMAALPLALITGLQVINHHMDILMLGMLRSASEVGVYKVVVTSAALVAFGLSAVNQVVAPHFARLYSQNDIARLQLMVTQGSRAILALAAPIVLVVFLFGDVVLGVAFGTEYITGYLAMLILAGGQLVNASMGSVAVLLNMTGHEQDTLRAIGIAAAMKIVFNLILISLFGIAGAAASTATTLILWNLMLRHCVRIRLGIETMAFGPRPPHLT